MQRAYSPLGLACLAALLGGPFLSAVACSGGKEDPPSLIGGGGSENGGASGSGDSGNGGSGNTGNVPGNGGSGGFFDLGDAGACPRTTCAELGWACGYTVDLCGNVVDCSEEGLSCAPNQVCVGGVTGPTECQAGTDPTCALCNEVPDCSGAADVTKLTGRVITPGRDDANTANQVGVPNAVVYIMRTDQITDLPAITVGIPSGGESCDRCEDQNLGPLLAGAITDASGNFTISGNVPVGAEFLLVVKAGKFRRVIPYTVPDEGACQTTALATTMPDNPTRLPRDLADGLAVNIPKIAITTGRIDAMECVFEKMGIAAAEFGNFGSATSVHLYRGSGQAAGTREGAVIAGGSPNDDELYGSLERMQSYDMVVSDCEGTGWDGKTSATFPERVANGDKVREYVNRGGRLFASHLSFSWLNGNGSTPYDAATPVATGLNAAATWDLNSAANTNTAGNGVVSLIGSRPNVSARIDSFASWLVNEGVTEAPEYEFPITDPRSMAITLGPDTEEFVYRTDGNGRSQQVSFDTPYGAPTEAACGRVAYSGFHVATTGGGSPFVSAVFPTHCQNALANDGDLTDQEKVLLYMLFDLGACVGDSPLPPPCVPTTCQSSGSQRCGFQADGCGNVLDCGPCRPPA